MHNTLKLSDVVNYNFYYTADNVTERLNFKVNKEINFENNIFLKFFFVSNDQDRFSMKQNLKLN